MKGRTQLVGAGGGYDAGVYGESRVSSGDGGAMGALGRQKPDEGLGRAKTEAPMVGDREKGGLKVDRGGAPVSTAPFPELASESAAMSWAEIDATKVVVRRMSRWCPCMARGGGSRRRCRR